MTGAVAADANTVIVTFDRSIDPSTILGDGSQFSVDMGLGVTGAIAGPGANQVTITTDTQTSGTTYMVTVAGTIMDVLGVAVDSTMNTATFDGYTPPASRVLINEVDYDNAGSDNAEYVELFNPGTSSVPIDNMAVVLVNGGSSPPAEYGRATLTGSLAGGAYMICGISGQTLTLPSGVTVVDFMNGASAVSGIQNGAPDGVALIDTSAGTVLDALSYEGSITAATITGITGSVSLVEGTATSVADSGDGSLSRLPNGSDTDDASVDWGTGMSTPGAANVAM